MRCSAAATFVLLASVLGSTGVAWGQVQDPNFTQASYATGVRSITDIAWAGDGTNRYLFITQQDEIGIGTYTLEDAFLFVGLNLPQYAFDMLPIAALIGSLLALGNLARSMELIVVRAAGVSVARIAMWVAGAGVMLMILTGVLGELVAPQMEQYGRRMKTFEKYHDYSLAGNRSAWAKDGDTIVSVGQQSGDNRYGGVYVFHFDPQHRLRSVGRATSASIDANNVAASSFARWSACRRRIAARSVAESPS